MWFYGFKYDLLKTLSTAVLVADNGITADLSHLTQILVKNKQKWTKIGQKRTKFQSNSLSVKSLPAAINN